MSKKEPDGYAEISPEGEFTGTEQEIYIKREKPSDTHVQNVESMGYQVIPVWLSDTPPVSREVLECLRALQSIVVPGPEMQIDFQRLMNILYKLEKYLPEQKEHE